MNQVDKQNSSSVVEGEADVNAARYDFGYSLMGPVMAEYLMKLNGFIRFFEEVRGAKVLFVSRAGIRIRRALEVYLNTIGESLSGDVDYFWISRLMVAKGTWKRNRENAIAILSGEFHHATIRDFANAMYRHFGLPEGFPADHSSLDQPGSKLARFFGEGGPAAYAISSYFTEQSEFFEQYLSDLMGDRKTALLIDSGWAGTAQRLLADAFPEIDWWGAYFGRSGFENTNRKYWRKMIGLVFEQDTYEYDKPETCTILHRHMIEDLLEPSGESIERLVRDEDGRICAPEARGILADSPDRESDPIFTGVLNYLYKLPDGNSPASLHKAARKAWEKIARIVALPDREETRIFSSVTRSADFGKNLKVPLLLPPKNRHEGDSPDQRIRDALWQPGQAALEYPPDLADPIQRRIAGLDRFDFKRPKVRPAINVVLRDHPAVAVITRTLDRPMFLRRALRSVARQTFDDYVHVIVSDGGDIELVKRTIAEADCAHHKIVLVDNVVNRGMEAASNIAIRAVDSEYVIIHDDDDTWEPDFLKKTVAFLDGPKGRIYGGVITRSTYVSEEVTPDGIVIHGTAPYQGWVENVHIMEMAIQNFFPPIAFLFRRDIYDKIGGFNEDYPVLGDWDFNLRFLMETDIGMVHEALANYHHRDRGDTTLFGNSVIAGRDKHLEYSAIVRNRFARNMLHADHPAMAVLVGMGLHIDAIRSTTRQLHDVTTEHRTVMENIAQQAQAAMSVVQTRSSNDGAFDSDDYWVAMSRLERAVVTRDLFVLKKIGMRGVKRWRHWLSRVGLAKRVADGDLKLSLEAIRFLISMNRKGYELEPPPDFDDNAYLVRNPDVAAEVERGGFSCGYDHYYRYGRAEGRQRTTKIPG